MAYTKDKWIQKLLPLQRKFGYDQKWEWDKLALKYFDQCSGILDIGCGSGRFISHDPERITGIDNNPDHVHTCLSLGYQVVRSKADNLPYGNQSIEGIHCSHLIEHLYPAQAHKLLQEFNRILQIGGILCIRTPLLYPGFYDDMTHIKPYNHKAILHYLKTKERTVKTLPDMDCEYRVIAVKFRRAQIFAGIADTKAWPLYILFNVLYRFGISGLKKTGYMLVLRKIR